MNDYEMTRRIAAPSERVFDALATLEGLRGWWTPLVSGSTAPGEIIDFEFEGLDEHILMRVEESRRPERVRWTCLEHSSLPEWADTDIAFTVRPAGDDCELVILHRGLTPQLECYAHCEAGWDYFAASIARLVESGQGTPYRAANRRR